MQPESKGRDLGRYRGCRAAVQDGLTTPASAKNKCVAMSVHSDICARPANVCTLNRVALTSSRSSNRVPASRSGSRGRTGKVYRKGRCQTKNAEAFVTAEQGVVVDAVGDMGVVGRLGR